MLIFPKARLTYLAIPKTGTTAIEAALLPRSGLAFQANPFKHMTLGEYRAHILPLLRRDPELDADGFETVCMIRDPLEYLQSWYRYRARARGVPEGRSTAGISFPDFVAAVLSGTPPEFAAVERQSDFIRDGAARVTTLLRYGDPGTEDFFAQRLGFLTEFPRRNVSPKQALAPLPDALERRLREAWAAEFDLFASIPPIDVPAWPRPSALRRRLRTLRQAGAELTGQ